MLNATADEEVAMAAAANTVLHTLDASNGSAAAAASRNAKRRGAQKRQRGGDSAAGAPNGTRADLTDKSSEEGPLLQGFHLVAMEDARQDLLHEIEPVFVILYDLDLAWIRQLEVYKSMHPERPLKVRARVCSATFAHIDSSSCLFKVLQHTFESVHAQTPDVRSGAAQTAGAESAVTGSLPCSRCAFMIRVRYL